jgi:glycosyltransferase involved in cell wall biosynthesis
MSGRNRVKISVVIPALNEEDAIGGVVQDVPRELVDEIIVADNGSTDDTVARAAAAGARVVREPRRGYGAACLAGAKATGDSEIIVFLDGDHSDDPTQLARVAGPVLEDRADLVVGSRLKGKMEKGSMPWHGRLGNATIVWLLKLLYGANISDLGSFRAIKRATFLDLNLEQLTYGWPVEMVVKAAKRGWRVRSVPVPYRKRLGKSKVSGTVRGSLMAAYFMFFVPLRYLWRD